MLLLTLLFPFFLAHLALSASSGQSSRRGEPSDESLSDYFTRMAEKDLALAQHWSEPFPPKQKGKSEAEYERLLKARRMLVKKYQRSAADNALHARRAKEVEDAAAQKEKEKEANAQ